MARNSNPEIERIIRREFTCSPTSYWRAAALRLEVARHLHENTVYQLDAVYLAGYVAECSLKALIVGRTPKPKWSDACLELGGAVGHNLDYLEGILDRKACPRPADITEALNVIKRGWMTKLRYEGVRIPFEESESILGRVTTVHEWVGRCL